MFEVDELMSLRAKVKHNFKVEFVRELNTTFKVDFETKSVDQQ